MLVDFVLKHDVLILHGVGIYKFMLLRGLLFLKSVHNQRILLPGARVLW